jgi:hypothetical protein
MVEPTPSALKRAWISDRTIGFAGVVIGIVSIVVSAAIGYYFYQKSTEYRRLTFAVNPIRTTIVNSSISSDLSVLYKGNVVHGSNLSSIRLYVWNQGNKPIIPTAHDILRPIRLSFIGAVEILDHRILQISGPEIGFGINNDPSSKDSLEIDFTILESGDGAYTQETPMPE